jgi:carbohydrate-selective porin OprB
MTVGTMIPNALGYCKVRGSRGAILPPQDATTSAASIEVTYLAQIASWLAVQPDFQYVIHPNTDATVRNAGAFQLRFETMF